MEEQILKYLKEHPKALFVVWLLAQIGSWIINLPSWSQALTTQSIGSLLLGIAAVAGAGGAASIIARVNPGAPTDGR